MRMVIALGGNAIQKATERGTAAEQFHNVRETCECIWELIKDHDVVITHGNGPQVGSILIQQEASEPVVPSMPLDICVAESQGLIGYMIQQSLRNVLKAHHVKKEVATIICQVVIDESDPAFTNPTKPVGPFYSKERAKKLQEKGITTIEDSGRGYRRVVPSPDPQWVVEAPIITSLLDQGKVVIGAGGGGIPVSETNNLSGIEAVVDKDLASERLAEAIDAKYLIILTDVNQVALNYGEETQKDLDVLKIQEAEQYIKEGHFAPGSMKPKIQAAIRFLKAGGKKVIITSPPHVREALAGKGGTEIVPF
jgi:carbamate kinase